MRFGGVPDFAGLKLCQDEKVSYRPEWGIRCVTVNRATEDIVLSPTGTLGWGGNSGFGAINIAVQTGATRIILVGFDMRIDKGMHWHGLHGRGLNNPIAKNVERWRRSIDNIAPTLFELGITVVNASPISALDAYPKMDLVDGFSAPLTRPNNMVSE